MTWDTTQKPETKRILCITLDTEFPTAYIVENGKVVTKGFSVLASRMDTLQVGFLVDALRRFETGKDAE